MPWVSLTVPDNASTVSLVVSPELMVAVKPVVVPITVLKVAVGAVVSMVKLSVAAFEVLLAASVAVTDTLLLPLVFKAKVPLVGCAMLVSILQLPPIAVVL